MMSKNHDVHTSPVLGLLVVIGLSPRNDGETEGRACACLLRGAGWCAVVGIDIYVSMVVGLVNDGIYIFKLHNDK